MKAILKTKIEEVVKSLNIEDCTFTIEHPTDISHGEWTTNIAMIAGNKGGKNPKEVAEEIVSGLGDIDGVESVDIAGPGFINFKLTHKAIIDSLDIEGSGLCKGKKVLVEYTNPNPFKQFHIGHLMSNAVGQVISNLYESQGADVKRLSYGGDFGLHVAKAIWGMKDTKKQSISKNLSNEVDKIEQWGNAYSHGAAMYEEDESIKEEIDNLNKIIFDHVVNHENFKFDELYKEGKEVSQKHFEDIYEILGTRFDKYYFESDVVERGQKIVKENNIFEESDGAIIFKGEDHGLHTRVFINSKGIPLYETKELGLSYKKAEDFEYDESIVVTASEQSEYFKVVNKALEMIDKNLADKTTHVTHGMMRFTDGKMSSRKGNIITGESLLLDLIEEVNKKMEGREVKNKEKASQQIAVAALKYSILRQAPGKNIIFNPEEALSLEGDSGPYVQYAYTRAKRLIEKSKSSPFFDESIMITDIEKILMKFNTILDRSYIDLAPQYIVTYLLTLSHSFNGFYQSTQIIGGENEGHNIAIVEKVTKVIEKGLSVLGIDVPEEM